MSLFGTSPNEPMIPAETNSRNLLFDKEIASPGSESKSSMFADDNTPVSSPWRTITPHKENPNDYIESLISTSAVPDSYNEIFKSISKDSSVYNGNVNRADVLKTLVHSKLNAEDEQLVLHTIYQGTLPSDLSRKKFNVLLALIGLAQERDKIALDRVNERTQSLPVPNVSGLSESSPRVSVYENTAAASPTKSITTIAPSLSREKTQANFHYSDPWASSAEHPDHRHHQTSETNGTNNEISNVFHIPSRSISSLSRNSDDRADNIPVQLHQEPIAHPIEGWASSNRGSSDEAMNEQISPDNKFGIDIAREYSSQGGPSLSIGTSQETCTGTRETAVITLLPEKEGFFMFQHHNYQVSSTLRGSKVVRRYSDFVWLLDCLQKRFAFRQLPLLPPKRVGLNGNHLVADRSFIEKRRRGLARFTNALLRHPVVANQKQELSVWRKQASFSIQDEFSGRLLPPGLEESLPLTLNELFERTRAGISKSADIYVGLCILMDRLAKRNEGLAADQLRISLSLQLLCDVTLDTYLTNSKDVPLLNRGLHASANHLANSQSLLIDEAKAWDQGAIEDLKTQRDSLVSMRQLFERRDQFGKDNIPFLERRIKKNKEKLEEIRARPEGIIKPEEVRKVTEAITKDKESIVSQHTRGIFIKECIRDELIHFQQTQYHMSRWSQDWAQERVKYSELQADNWKKLIDELERVPSA